MPMRLGGMETMSSMRVRARELTITYIDAENQHRGRTKSRRGAFMESLRESSNRGCGATRVVVIPQLFHHTLMHALPSVTDMLLNILFATNDSMQTYDNKIYHER